MVAPPRKPLKKISDKRLQSLGGKTPFSSISKRSESPRKSKDKDHEGWTKKALPSVANQKQEPRTRIRPINPEATRKRRLRNQKRMRSPEYKAAKAGAMERSGGRCEYVDSVARIQADRDGRYYKIGRDLLERCPETERLQFHEVHYARGRILTPDDGMAVCPWHHRYLESLKPYKQHRRGF